MDNVEINVQYKGKRSKLRVESGADERRDQERDSEQLTQNNRRRNWRKDVHSDREIKKQAYFVPIRCV